MKLILCVLYFSPRRADRKPSAHSQICSCHFPSGKKKAPALFVAPNDPTRHIFGDHSYVLREESTVNETVPLFMDEGEESATLYMADKDEDPPSLAVVEGPQPPTNNVEEHPGRSTVEEELQSERRKRIQLEIKLARVLHSRDKVSQGQAAKTKLLS